MNLGGVVHLNKPGICILFVVFLVLFIYMLSNPGHNDTQSSVKINLKHLLEVSINAAENGGKEVVGVKDNLNVKLKGLTKEGMPDRVTTADYLSHCAILKTLKHAYPSLNVISEETKVDCDENQKIDYVKSEDVPKSLGDDWVDLKDVTVWIDPLDATYEYTGKLYQFVTTMVCVAVQGEPIIGVIHKPFLSNRHKTFWAWVNKAKSSNLNYVERKKEKLKVIMSMSHAGPLKDVLAKSFDNFETVSAAGAGYKALEVATGNLDAYVHITAIKKWDICAGNAIINAMGGKMTTKTNQKIDYKDESNVQNENGLVATIKEHDVFIGKL